MLLFARINNSNSSSFYLLVTTKTSSDVLKYDEIDVADDYYDDDDVRVNVVVWLMFKFSAPSQSVCFIGSFFHFS